MSNRPKPNPMALLGAVARETLLPMELQQHFDRSKKSPHYTVLMGRMFNPPRSGLHKDVVRNKISLKEALESLRGFRLGFHLGGKRIDPGPQAIKLYGEDNYES